MLLCSYVTSCSFSPDGRCLASTSSESVKIWSLDASGEILHLLSRPLCHPHIVLLLQPLLSCLDHSCAICPTHTTNTASGKKKLPLDVESEHPVCVFVCACLCSQSQPEVLVPQEAMEEVCQWVEKLAVNQSRSQPVTEQQQAAGKEEGRESWFFALLSHALKAKLAGMFVGQTNLPSMVKSGLVARSSSV